MGVIASIRQTPPDAQHYKATWDYYQQNATSFGDRRTIGARRATARDAAPVHRYGAGSVLMIDKAVRLGAEFGIKPSSSPVICAAPP